MKRLLKFAKDAWGKPALPAVQQEMMLRSAEQFARVLNAAPFFALLILVALRDGQPRTIEVIWSIAAGGSGIAIARWFGCRLRKDRALLSVTVYRLGVGVVHFFAAIIPLVFRPRSSAASAALEVVVAITLIVVLQTLTAADRRLSYALLAAMITASIPGLEVLRSVPFVLLFLDSVMVFVVLSPLTEAIHRPQRESIELAFANHDLVRELRDVNLALSTQLVTDPLTGLLNRSGLDVALHTLGAVGLLFIDVDAFKSVNDRFGHAIGDEVLQRIALILQHVARENDVVCRLAGDEFVMLLDGATQPKVEEIAERIRARVGREFADQGISVSVGGTLGDLRSEPPSGILSRADGNLYSAKEQGRDRACVRC